MIVKHDFPHITRNDIARQMGGTEDDDAPAINLDWLKVGLVEASLALGFYTTYLATKRGYMQAIEETR